eukprot:Rmarinus@m.16887
MNRSLYKIAGFFGVIWILFALHTFRSNSLHLEKRDAVHVAAPVANPDPTKFHVPAAAVPSTPDLHFPTNPKVIVLSDSEITIISNLVASRMGPPTRKKGKYLIMPAQHIKEDKNEVAVVKFMFRQHGLREGSQKNWDVSYGGETTRTNKKQWYHFVLGLHAITKKQELCQSTMSAYKNYGEDWLVTPPCYSFPEELPLYENEVAKKKKKTYWIFKEPGGYAAKKIEIFDSGDSPPNKVGTAQLYLHEPWLVDHRKGELRVYIGVTSVNPLRFVVATHGFVMCASVRYKSGKKHFTDLCMQIGNSIYQEAHCKETFRPPECRPAGTWCHPSKPSQFGHVWPVDAYLKDIADHSNVKATELWNRVRDACRKAIFMAYPSMMTDSLAADANKNSFRRSYQIVGVDILFDEDLKPWILEINNTPSMAGSNAVNSYEKRKMFGEFTTMMGSFIDNYERKAYKEDTKKAMVEFCTRERAGCTEEDIDILGEHVDQVQYAGSWEVLYPDPSRVADDWKYIDPQFRTPENVLLRDWVLFRKAWSA